MITIRRSQDRGHFNHGWLDTYHTFSFAGYRDPKHRGFHTLRVMNEDRVQPGEGFGTHGHKDMEIISYVLDGSLEHRDSMGNGSVLRAGELQRITAGSGILHSEFNPSTSEAVHLYQIWLYPRQENLPPSYEQMTVSEQEKRGRLRVVASADGRDGSLTIQQDADVFLGRIEPGPAVSHRFHGGHQGWLQVVRGELTINTQTLQEGDGAAIEDESNIELSSTTGAEVILFDLA